jgi:cobyrinic acid a,c-diamide synthase
MQHPSGWLIAAPRSGSGKTTVTIGLVAALRARGVPVRTAKSGPDYIDPAFHAAASGQPGTNLDSWAMPPALLDGLAAGPGLLIVESAMGLFDGVEAPPGRTGASADLAERFTLPVLLVLDVSGQSQTAAAIAHGLNTYRPGVHIGGVILNRVGSDRHRTGIMTALAAIGLPVMGAIPRDPTLSLPERHLGLVQAREHPALQTHLAALAAMAERHLDIDAIVAAAAALTIRPGTTASLPPPGQRIALAQDDAFSFIYPHLLRGWRDAGAEIIPFSPLANEPPAAHADACWLPGGYPELHAPRLAAATRFIDGLRRFATQKPVHGECGGFMALGATLQSADGTTHRMANLLGHTTSVAAPRMTLGYREATLLADHPLGPAGTRIRSHEFHYATQSGPAPEATADTPFASIVDGQGNPKGPTGARRGLVSGSFLHAIATTTA